VPAGFGPGHAQAGDGAGVPADSDAAEAGLAETVQADVADQAAQQTLAVLGSGSRGVPQGGDVLGQLA
jgi:hypothetical protein